MLAFLLLVAATVLLIGFLGGAQYRVRTVIVNGNRLAFAESVVRESGVLGTSVFRIDTRAVAERLVQHPAIAQATVRAFYPDTVVIELVEREPASAWITPERTWLVDRDGRVIGSDEQVTVPQVEVHDGLTLQLGASVPRAVARAVPAIVERYGDRLARLEYDGADGLVLVLAGGQRVVLGGAERLDEQLAVLDALLARDATWLHLDVRDPDRPVLWRVRP